MVELPKQLQDKKFRFIKIDSGTKRPIEEKWSDYNNYKYSETEFRNYLKTAQSYGVACGFGNLIIVDIEKIEDKSVANLVMNHVFPETFTVQTGSGGWHLYYFVPGLENKIILTKKGKHYGEIQTDGSQCVGPGSLHPSGKRYTILNNTDIKTIKKDTLIEIVKDYIEEDEFEIINSGTKPLDWDISKLLDYCPGLKTKDEIEYQGPHPVHGSTGGNNFTINVEKNFWHCFRCNVGGDTVSLIAMLEGLIEINDRCPTKQQFKKEFLTAKKIGIEKYGFLDDGFKIINDEEELRLFIKKGRKELLNTVDIVEYLRQQCPIIAIEDATGRATHIYIYQDGYYKLNGESILRTMIKELFNVKHSMWTKHYEEEIVSYIKTDNPKKRDEIKPPDNLINLNNGIYDIATKTLLPHTSTKYFLYKIPWDYNVKATKLTKTIFDFFNSIFKEKKIYIEFMQELFGFCMYSRYDKYHGLFYLYGTGGNGKTVLLKLLEEMLGEENVSNKSITSLISHRFTTALLYGKLLNTCGELTESVMNKTDMLKRLTAGDKIQAEFKGKDGFDFQNTAKIITASNSIPVCYDRTDGWYERQYIIPFLEKFRDTIKQDNELIDKLITKVSMESLLFWSIQGLHRLLKNKKFTYPFNKKERYLMCQGNVEYFITRIYEKADFNSYEFVDVIREDYLSWCKENDMPVDSDQALSNGFRHLDYPEKLDRLTINGEKKYIRRYVKRIE